jgi:GMP reductase
MNKSLSYQNIYLVPKYSELTSRNNADVSIKFGNKKFNLPVTPSNMLSVINDKWAYFLSEADYFYVMHRFGNNISFLTKANSENWKTISISVGVNENSISDIVSIFEMGLRVDYITIDVAHGHHLKVKAMISLIKKFLPNTFIIAGNTASKEATKDLESWGADATKCCIGSGMACSTKYKTGFHVPPFSCVLECASVAKKPIIADGGVKTYGDIAKALVAGANMVMCGGIFASCSDSPAPIENGKKIYFGNASERAKGEYKHVEGFEVELNQDQTLLEKLNDIKESIQSSVSYSGGFDLSCFKNIKYVVV